MSCLSALHCGTGCKVPWHAVAKQLQPGAPSAPSASNAARKAAPTTPHLPTVLSIMYSCCTAHVLLPPGKKSLAETGIVRRIHFIYERATRKFRADLSLWMRWIAACERFRSSKQLSKVCVNISSTRMQCRRRQICALCRFWGGVAVGDAKRRDSWRE